MKYDFNIHGDNIVECERALMLCKKALKIESFQLNNGSTVFCPSFTSKNCFNEYSFTFIYRENVDLNYQESTNYEENEKIGEFSIIKIEKEQKSKIISVPFEFKLDDKKLQSQNIKKSKIYISEKCMKALEQDDKIKLDNIKSRVSNLLNVYSLLALKSINSTNNNNNETC